MEKFIGIKKEIENFKNKDKQRQTKMERNRER
jgi:hypothetical protein